MNTAFSHALCVLICPSCGAAVAAATSGGEAVCGVCAEAMEVRPRAQPMSLPPPGSAPPPGAPESELPPLDGDLLALTIAGEGRRLDPAAADRAMRAWQGLRAGRGPQAESAFLQLTLLLDDHMRGQHDDLQRRAMLETAAACTTSGRYRQVLLAELAVSAARAGDLAAADDWLAECEPRAGGTQAESARRFAAAFIASERRQPRRVLEIAGQPGAPQAARLAPRLALLRAHAHASLGAAAAAEAELEAALRAGTTDEVERAVDEVGATKLREALERVRRQRQPKPRATARPERNLVAELPWMVLGAIFYALALIIDPASTTARGQRLDVLFLVLAIAAMVPLGFMVRRRRRAAGPRAWPRA
jgi:hypothetical protein